VTILCEFEADDAAAIAPALGGHVQLAANLPEAAIGLVEDKAESVVVVGRHAPLDQVLDFTAKVLEERPKLNVILVRSDYDPKAVSAAMAAGVREVVAAGDPSFVVAAIQRATAPVAVPQQSSFVAEPQMTSLIDELMPTTEDAPPPPDGLSRPPAHLAPAAIDVEPEPAAPPPGKIITVFSPKGGSGKTTIATNLAVALSESGRPVCLVDLDLEFGDVAISLRLTPVRTLADAVKTEAIGDEDDALRMLTTEYRPGLNCILAPIEPGDAEKIPASLVTDLLALLRPRYAFVVIDTPSQFSQHVLAALDASDHHLLLTNPEIPSLKNLRLTLDMLDLLHYPRERRSIIFNRADSAAGLSAAEVEETIKAPIAVQVPASRDVPASINQGVPIVAARPDHQVSAAIRRFAVEQLGGAPESGARRGHRRGILRRKTT
jgi:pilus assembly protein CpaE